MLMRPMHEPKVSALDEHQHQRKCTGFESFLEHQDLRMYWPNSYTSVNSFILWLIYQLNDLKRKYLTVNNTLFTHENVSEPIIAPGRGMFMPMNQSEQALTKDKIIHVSGAISHLLRQNFVGIVRRRYVDKILHFYSYFLHFTTF